MSFGGVIGCAAGAVALLMLALWLVSIRLRDVSIVDPVWGPAFVLVAVVAAAVGDGDAGRRWLVVVVTALWGGRLGWYLVRRKLSESEEDRRYARMRRAKGDRFVLWSLGMIFGLQGLLVLVVSLPITASSVRGDGIGVAMIPGLVLFSVGLGFEAVGDEQLRRFKSSAANQGQVMDRGLWRYTRHPNYFGDVCVWWGIWLVVLPAGGTWWSAVGPVVMTFLLVRVSGKALLERDISRRRPEYVEYIERTSGFFPLPPKRAKRQPAARADSG